MTNQNFSGEKRSIESTKLKIIERTKRVIKNYKIEGLKT